MFLGCASVIRNSYNRISDFRITGVRYLNISHTSFLITPAPSCDPRIDTYILLKDVLLTILPTYPYLYHRSRK